MTAHTIVEHLADVQGHYERIRAITASLGTEPPQEAIERALDERAVVFAQIEAAQRAYGDNLREALGRVRTDGRSAALLKEIEKTICEIFGLDLKIRGVIDRRMRLVKCKLEALSDRSKAAVSYATRSRLDSYAGTGMARARAAA
jgi:hypothetical protein